MEISIPTSSQLIGREIVRKYYFVLCNVPKELYRFYNEDSTLEHFGLDENQNLFTFNGRDNIKEAFAQLYCERKCSIKVDSIDAQPTLNNGIVIQIVGEMSKGETPMKQFVQTLVLAMLSANKYYIHNEIFRYIYPNINLSFGSFSEAELTNLTYSNSFENLQNGVQQKQNNSDSDSGMSESQEDFDESVINHNKINERKEPEEISAPQIQVKELRLNSLSSIRELPSITIENKWTEIERKSTSFANIIKSESSSDWDSSETDSMKSGSSVSNHQSQRVVNPALMRRQRRQLFIGNIPNDANRDKLRKIFSQFGNIVDFHINSNRGGGKFAFISYENAKSAQKCLNTVPIFYTFDKEPGRTAQKLNVEQKLPQEGISAKNLKISK